MHDDSSRVRLSARISAAFAASIRLECWRREEAGLDGSSVHELVRLAVEALPEDVAALDELLLRAQRAIDAPQEHHLQPRVPESTAAKVRLVARSLVVRRARPRVTGRHVVITAIVALLDGEDEAHNPYEHRSRPETAPRPRYIPENADLGGHDARTQRHSRFTGNTPGDLSAASGDSAWEEFEAHARLAQINDDDDWETLEEPGDDEEPSDEARELVRQMISDPGWDPWRSSRH